jgi:ribose-phosphate pyrophosphokinase
VIDPHSDVIEGVIDNVYVVDQAELLSMVEADFIQEYQDVISPDAGAYKKVFKVAQKFDRGVIRADKIRNLSDGSLSGFEVYANDLSGRSVLIVDDICDGGGTFVGLAKKLREKGAKSVGLYVSHGMFTKGVEILKEHIDKIYCYTYYGSNSKDLEFIETLKARKDV